MIAIIFSGGFRFKFQVRDSLSWVRIFVPILSPSRWIVLSL